ncbi:MAG: FtsX-like permease family protein [Roseivirga sp.]|nr:FtsX-like permease family protein [Roseivirga sp.]
MVKKDYLEEIEGDLDELYIDFLDQYSRTKARRLYNKEVIKLLRPVLVKGLSGSQQLNQYGMFKNYFKSSFRSLKNNTLFSAINMVGLAISMSVGILMILFLSELSSIDDFHTHKDDIYRITSSEVRGTQNQMVKTASSSYYMGLQLEAQVPGIEKTLILDNTRVSFDLKAGDKATPITGFYAGASFFDVLSFKLLQGNPETALTEPNGLVLTQSAAKRLFGDSNPMGQLVSAEQDRFLQTGAAAGVDFKEGIVTGVVQDPPHNSHLQFEMLISLSTLDLRAVQEERDIKNAPGNTNYSVYLVLSENAKKAEIEKAMERMLSNYNTDRADNPLVHNLQPMGDFVTSDTYHSTAPSFSQERIYLMAGLTFIVLLSACFNYTNLSLARALRRSKEVGIRKVTGATRFQVFAQFMVEAVLLSVLAMFAGLVLFVVIRPGILNLAPPSLQGYSMFRLTITPVHLLYFLLFAIAVGAVAGFLPALFHSKLRAGMVFQEVSKVKFFSGVNLRKLLIVFQFTLSIGLIMCAVLINNQYNFALSYDLGYTTDQVITIDIKGDYIDLLENEYAQLSEVVETSKSTWVLGVGGDGLNAGMIQPEDRKGRAISLINHIDERYMDMHELHFLAGSNFLTPLVQGETAKYVIVNEGLLKKLELGSPKASIGKTLWCNGQKVTIQGVVEDMVTIGLTKKFLESFVFIQTNQPDQYKSLNVKVQSNDLGTTFDRLEAIYTAQDPVHPFKAALYNDKIRASYESNRATRTIISFLAFLAISISTLGLLGMAVFTTETRMKEISIRKVLGAGVSHLMVLLSRSFLLLIVIAGLIAIPVTLYIVDSQVLNNFWQRAETGVFETVSGLLIVLLISILTIGWQIRQAAIKNPADLLRNE